MYLQLRRPRIGRVRRWILGAGALSLASCLVSNSRVRTSASSLAVPVPLGLDLAAPVPEDNPLSRAKIDLGRLLFFEPVLSADRSLSCSSCHQPAHYFANGRRVSQGIAGRKGHRNVPSILNVAYGRSFFWDGRAPTLEVQVLGPIQGHSELGMNLQELMVRLQGEDRYRTAFRHAFGKGEITPENLARALASYLRTLRSGNAPIDRYLHGDTSALSPDARKGFRLFTGRANCGACHIIPLFTDHRFHNTGVSWGSADSGRIAVTGDSVDRGAFKTPSLRNVAMTAPYMHDGSLASLEDVVDRYDRGGMPNPYLDEEIHPLRLTPVQKRQLIAFLRSLTGTTSPY